MLLEQSDSLMHDLAGNAFAGNCIVALLVALLISADKRPGSMEQSASDQSSVHALAMLSNPVMP